MGNENTKEFSTFVTPDSLRKILQLLKNFYAGYTKKNYGYEDINGSQYTGNIHNFGSELLLEARKILMNKPSLKQMFIQNTFDFYFNIQYSGLIDTYDQQSLLVATIEKDVLLSNKKYYIRFDNCDDKFILRSESWSDPIVRRDHFVHTKTPPTLVIKNDSDEIEKEIPLILSDKTDVDTDYYFFINPTTSDMIDDYDKTNGTLITKRLFDSMYERPIVWMCIDELRLLPDIKFRNNLDVNNHPLLTIGTDGHDVSRLYPMIYGVDNVPSSDTGTWYIKVTASDEESFYPHGNPENNYNVQIKSITFVNADDIGKGLHYEQTITFDHTYCKMTLSHDVEWLFKIPTSDDFDYDGMTYNNPCYAYIKLDAFNENIHVDDNERKDLKSAFIVKFNHKYLHPYEAICNNAVSGIHVDASTDYSDNSVSKKNGVIHNLGDFDGLPKYFSYMLERTIHRIHTELYSIRDDLNNRNQKAIDKQTAALILDTAIPQNEIQLLLEELNLVIKYDKESGRLYKSDGESISPNNTLSEITYIDDDTFGNITLNEYLEQFLYHSGRTFSLGMMELDPELEIARVYYISNDGISYENNEKSEFKKPGRCLARICDIPTSFLQLIKIEGKAPTLVIDQDYVRSEVPFMSEDKENIWNNKNYRWVKFFNEVTNKTKLIFSEMDNLDSILNVEYLKKYYSRSIQLNESLDMTNPVNQTNNYEFTIHEGGSGYAVDDTFTIIIGGIYFKGTINGVDPDGVVTSMTISSNKDAIINVGNLSSDKIIYKTTTTTGTGSGLQILLTIKTEMWNGLQQKQSSIFDDLYTYKTDKFGNLWIWKYDTTKQKWYKHFQMTGNPIIDNYYDDYNTQQNRKFVDIFIKNMIGQFRRIGYNLITEQTSSSDSVKVSKEVSNIPYDVDVNTTDDLSSLIENVNRQDTLYALQSSSIIDENHNVLIYQRYPMESKSAGIKDVNKYELPRFHQLNLSKYFNKSNVLSYSHLIINNQPDINSQPILSVYNPMKSTVEKYEMICQDVIKQTSSSDLTFKDVLKTTEETVDIIESNGSLNRNVYVYNEYDEPTQLTTLRDKLYQMSHDELIKYIKGNLGEYALPLQFEETKYQYTNEMLIDYIMINSYTSPLYKKDDIKLLRMKDEKVVDYVNGKYTGIGKQPTGGYESITDDILNPNVYVKGYSKSVDIMFVFRIEEDPTLVGSLDGFRIFDDNGYDISEYSLLIYNYNKYIFSVDKKRWIMITNS